MTATIQPTAAPTPAAARHSITVSVWTERLTLLNDYQANAALMSLTGRSDAAFMHCLPAFHDRHTK